tara:strand:- start:205 stop:591 length:387 start_codon:yes stop_codon:yes gene_type:complete
MEFNVTAKKTYRFELTLEREYEVVVGKKAVVDAGLCANSVDGDTSAWYDFVEDYLREQGLEKFFDDGKVRLVSDGSEYHEQTEELEATKILKNYIDCALLQEDVPCLDDDGNGVEVTSSNSTIENVEW